MVAKCRGGGYIFPKRDTYLLDQTTPLTNPNDGDVCLIGVKTWSVEESYSVYNLRSTQLCCRTVKCSGMLTLKSTFLGLRDLENEERHQPSKRRRVIYPTTQRDMPVTWLCIYACYHIRMAIFRVCVDDTSILQEYCSAGPQHLTELSVLGGDTTHSGNAFPK